jgi:hypothetical protein
MLDSLLSVFLAGAVFLVALYAFVLGWWAPFVWRRHIKRLRRQHWSVRTRPAKP